MKNLIITAVLLVAIAEVVLVYTLRTKFNVKEQLHGFNFMQVSFNKSNRVSIIKNGKVAYQLSGKNFRMNQINLSDSKNLIRDKQFVTNAKINLDTDESSITINFPKRFPGQVNKISMLTPHLNFLSENYILLDETVAVELGYDAIKINPQSIRILESSKRGLTVKAQYIPIKKTNV